MRLRSRAKPRRSEETRTNGAMLCIASKRFLAGVNGMPVICARCFTARARYSGCALIPVPTAFPPSPSAKSPSRLLDRESAQPRTQLS